MNVERFIKNVEKWSLFNAVDAAKMLDVTCNSTKITPSKTGVDNLEVTYEGKYYPLHSPDDPEREAITWFNSLDLKDVDVLIVFGVGLGHYYKAALDWLHLSDNHMLIFLEDNLEVIHRLFEVENGSLILNDKQVWVMYIENPGPALEAIAEHFVLKSYLFSALNFYEKIRKDALNLLKSKHAFFLNIQRGVAQEYGDHGRAFFLNYFRNLFALPGSYLAGKLFNKFAGVPAIICGAGPSLDKQIDLLKTLTDKAIVFAGGTAMNALNSHGLMPHFGVGIDPNPAQFTRIIMNQAYEVPFFYRSRFLHEALKIIHGEHLYVPGSSGYDVARWFEKKLGIEGKNIQEGHNVLNFNLSLAAAMGCNPIILVGVDLAYTNNKSYASGIINHPLHEKKEYFRTKTPEEELVTQSDIYGDPILTLWKWVSESLWYTMFARENLGFVLINSTEGGIGFKEIPNMALREVSDKFLKKQYDISGMIGAEVTNAKLPASLTRQDVQRALQEFLESVKRTVDQTKKVYEAFKKSEQAVMEGKEAPPNWIDEEALQVLDEMVEESGYEYLLKIFSLSYETTFKRQFSRIQYDESFLTEQEQLLKGISPNMGRYKFLNETAQIVVKIIERVLEEEGEKDKLEALRTSGKMEILAVDEPLKGESYTFENGVLRYDDGKGFKIEETFVPDSILGKVESFTASGGLKSKQTYKEGKLHGPSEYYSEDGKLLSKFWYYDGQKIGKGNTFYPDGSLRSIERFKEGKRDGLQQFFYPNGSIKSSLPYSEGVLDGEVLLYFSNGRQARKLNFVKGKRKGKEFIWSPEGTLLIEAEFDMDRPVGMARKWYSNGNIAKEVSYDPDSDRFTVREWDKGGSIVNLRQESSEDYFESLVKKTDSLTEALETILKQVSNVAPLVEAVMTKGDKKQAIENIYKELGSVQKELSKLREISKKLAKEAGLDSTTVEEQIWKTPTHRKEIEQQVDVMAKDMTNEIMAIQNSLVTTVGLLTKKLREEKDRSIDKKND